MRFLTEKKENEKPNVWTCVSFEPVGSANKRTSWQYQIQFLFQRYLGKRKTSTIHDDECRFTEVQMTFNERYRRHGFNKKYDNEWLWTARFEIWMSWNWKFSLLPKCILPCEVLPLCHFHPVIKWCKYFCHVCKY